MSKTKFTEQMKAFLLQQPPEQVAEWLAEMAVSNTQTKKHWHAVMLLNSGKASDYKKLITQALPKKELLCTPNLWGKVSRYFAEAEGLFSLAFAQLDQDNSPLSQEQRFAWLVQAFERLNLVLEGIDDSGGYRLALEGELGARLVQCFHTLDWPTDKKTRWLHEYENKYDVFPYIPEQFELTGELAVAFRKHNKVQR